ncbi:bifunctional folylpolyglutamate synthase/dihydrofolate synthase [bacterium]|nr:bifunctional folylpolyglutamate synthase/dihydrofolate synthase [bacterium]
MTVLVETYEQAIEFLFGRINYERTLPDAYSANDFKLDRMRHLLAAVDNPQRQMPALHVAGTKGKGSVCSMLASILTSAGWCTGLYTSPHLIRFEERIQVDGQSPTSAELVELVRQLQPLIAEMDRSPARMHPTYFEIATAMAWNYFLQRRAGVAVLETGLGGRLDSTNLCQPWVTVITNISRDHTHILGSTIAEIATEKAGIIKPGIPVVTGCRHPQAIEVIERVCTERKARLWRIDRDFHWKWQDPKNRTISVTTPVRTWDQLPVPLRGEHQADNTAMAVAALDCLPESDRISSAEVLRRGLRTTSWPARIEVMSTAPTVVLDAAHNWASAQALMQTIDHDFPARRRILVFACSKDKDYRGLVRQLGPQFDTLIFTKFVDNPRAVEPEELRRHLSSTLDRPSHVAPDPVSAWKLARRFAHASDLVVITGSLFLVSELRELLLEDLRESPSAVTELPTVVEVPPSNRPVS